jgi:hypothetical protein
MKKTILAGAFVSSLGVGKKRPDKHHGLHPSNLGGKGRRDATWMPWRSVSKAWQSTPSWEEPVRKFVPDYEARAGKTRHLFQSNRRWNSCIPGIARADAG